MCMALSSQVCEHQDPPAPYMFYRASPQCPHHRQEKEPSGREGGKHDPLVEERRRDGHSPNHYLGPPNIYFELPLIAFKHFNFESTVRPAERGHPASSSHPGINTLVPEPCPWEPEPCPWCDHMGFDKAQHWSYTYTLIALP